MASIEETLSNINSFIRDVEENYPGVVAEAATTGLGLIQNRIQESGIGSDGSQLGDYTDGLYRTQRASRGLPTQFVNLTFTGEMWNDVGLVSLKDENGKITATIAPKTSVNDDKLFYNSIRYDDDILAVTESEEKEIDEILDDGLQMLIDKNFK